MQTESEPTGSPVDDAASPATGAAMPAPRALTHLVDLPEPRTYRLKNRLLGPPLHTEQLAHERLGNPTALAVFASDNLSSSAYATEEILRVLIPAGGAAIAFSLVVPLTIAMLIVLGFLILSYRQTIKAYPSAGGAYIVTKDNFGRGPAQLAGVSLLTDYVLTAAVSTAAGAAALASAFDVFKPYVLPIAIVFLLIIASGNLKGVKESGKAFAIPTYFFIANMVVLLTVGIVRWGSLQPIVHEHADEIVKSGTEDPTMLLGIGLFVLFHAFASGGAAVTGVEAISNGVPAFREPSWKNAQKTLVVMGSLLGVMFLGLSALASRVEAVPYAEGTPTVISQVARAVYAAEDGPVGHVLWLSLQAGTMLILVLAANTSYADFPRLASFQASDNFLPRQLTKRGHRLVFSNGIVALTAAAAVLLIFTGAKVERLIPMYAIGVFTSFTLSQAGMAKHHITHKEPKWVFGLVINGIGAFLSFVVLIVFAVTKFEEGAWIIIVLVPILVIPLFRLNKQYEVERAALASGEGAKAAAKEKILNRHVVLVLIDQLDMAASRAIQYARTLVPDELVAVHFDLDPVRTADLTASWSSLGFARLSLDVIECPDRRIERAAAEVVARHLVGGDTEVTVLLPRREYSRFWHRMVHDRTADKLTEILSSMPHCNVTIVPFHIGAKASMIPAIAPAVLGAPDEPEGEGAKAKRKPAKPKAPVVDLGDMEIPADRTPIAMANHRARLTLAGKVYAMRVQPWSGTPALELTLTDDTGAITLVFFGRRELAGVHAGSRLIVEGVVGEHRGKLAMLNPAYKIHVDSHADIPHS